MSTDSPLGDSAEPSTDVAPPDAPPAVAGALGPSDAAGFGTPFAAARPLETLNSVELPVTVELGRTRLRMKDLLNLRPGSVVELDRTAGAPVDILVNHTLLAHGEVVVVDDELGVRVTVIVGTDLDQGA